MKIGLTKKKTLIIAEVGLAHNGNLKTAFRFVKSAKKAGADIIKFQTHYAEFESTYDEPFRVAISKKYKNRYDYWKSTEFKKNEWEKIIKFCKKNKIIFATSPFSREAVRIMRSINCRNWKIGSGEILSNELLNEILKKKNDTIIISSGLSSWSEINNSYKYLNSKNAKFAILQCTTEYPSNIKKVGLNIIEKMKKTFNCPVGLSDHTGSIFPSIAALSLGAKIIEVHVCLSKKAKGPDITSSLTFDELEMICKARDSISIMKENDVNKNKLSSIQKKNRIIFSKSLALKKDLKIGEFIKKSNITLKKPGTGLSQKFERFVINKKAIKNLSSKKILRRSDFE